MHGEYVDFKTDPQILRRSTNVRSQCSAFSVSSLQVSIPVDYNNPPTVKNHNEVLRCFSLLGIKALVCLFVCLHELHVKSRCGCHGIALRIRGSWFDKVCSGEVIWKATSESCLRKSHSSLESQER